MRLSVATNFEPDLVDALAGYPVYDLFGKLPADALGGGRASYMLSPLSKRALAVHVRDAHRHAIRFNYLLNAACLDNREWTREGQRKIRRLLAFFSRVDCHERDCEECRYCHGAAERAVRTHPGFRRETLRRYGEVLEDLGSGAMWSYG